MNISYYGQYNKEIRSNVINKLQRKVVENISDSILCFFLPYFLSNFMWNCSAKSLETSAVLFH